ncbi:MAG: alpha/beta hydrolase [Burkholderiaceae bacterium]
MPILSLDDQNGLYYEHTPPTRDGAVTFVFVNPITGDVGLWNASVVPELQKAGFGTLVYNARGQANSPFAPGTDLTDDLIVGDLQQLLAELKPVRPVVAGLSIGGLYAARAYLAGTPLTGLVLINTLRRLTPRVAWMNDATLRVMEVGGPNLMKDLFFHLILNEDWQAAHRAEHFSATPDYTPLPRDSGAYNLITWMGKTDWDIPWHKLELPTLVIEGTQDRVFYDENNVAELFASLPKGTRIDMHDAGHMIPMERPQAFTGALEEFGRTFEG